MKVLGIAGSPRKDGNSTILLKEALKGAEERGAETELILLRDLKITPCEACWTCLKTGICKTEDVMQEMYPKLLAADGIIVASPTQFGSSSALCHLFFERCFCLARMKVEDGKPIHVQKTSLLEDKVGAAIVTGRRRGVQSALETLNYCLTILRIVLVYPGIAAYCQGLEQGAIEKEDKYAVTMSREMGGVVVKFIEKLKAAETLASKT